MSDLIKAMRELVIANRVLAKEARRRSAPVLVNR